MGPEIFQILIIIVLLAPLVHVLASGRSHGGAKFGWFIAVLIFSWLAYIAFLIITQKNADQNKLEQ